MCELFFLCLGLFSYTVQAVTAHAAVSHCVAQMRKQSTEPGPDSDTEQVLNKCEHPLSGLLANVSLGANYRGTKLWPLMNTAKGPWGKLEGVNQIIYMTAASQVIVASRCQIRFCLTGTRVYSAFFLSVWMQTEESQ